MDRPLVSALDTGYRDIKFKVIGLAPAGTGLEDSVTNVNFP